MELKFKVHTFGCKVNTYDSGLIEKRLTAQEEFTLAESDARIHVLNSCAVTQEATREAVRLARRLKARDPFCLVVATGCAAQVDTAQLSGQPAIDLVVANSHKAELQSLVRQHYAGTLESRVFKSNIFKKEDLEAGGGVESGHTRAFLKVQDGCNSFCTFCVIPFARGKSRSIPVSDLVGRVCELEAAGIREVVLTGVHIGDYDDHGRNLSALIRGLLKHTSIPRFRLSSLEPPELTEELIDLFGDERLCPHFHMSIQSAQSEVLRQMKRQYTAKRVEAALRRIETVVPNAFVGMDVIAGFPSESTGQFDETYRRLTDLPWTRLHVFPYSRRPGTYAARWEEIDGAEVKRRAARLRELSWDRSLHIATQQVGRTKRILGLRSRENVALGLARDFWTVEMPRTSENAPSPGAEAAVSIIAVSAANKHMSPHLLAD